MKNLSLNVANMSQYKRFLPLLNVNVALLFLSLLVGVTGSSNHRPFTSIQANGEEKSRLLANPVKTTLNHGRQTVNDLRIDVATSVDSPTSLKVTPDIAPFNPDNVLADFDVQLNDYFTYGEKRRGHQVVMLVVGYDRELCNDYGKNCRDSELSQAFKATGDSLENNLTDLTVYRVDVKELHRHWLDSALTIQEPHHLALRRTLGEIGATIAKNQGQVSAFIYVGHGFGAGKVGPTFEGESVNLIEAAQQVGLVNGGAIFAIACSVAVEMDLSVAKSHHYSIFATKEYVDWLKNGDIKLSSETQQAYTPATNFFLPEQTRSAQANSLGLLQQNRVMPTIQEAVQQAIKRTAAP